MKHEHFVQRLPKNGKPACFPGLPVHVALAHELIDLVTDARARYPEDVREFLERWGNPRRLMKGRSSLSVRRCGAVISTMGGLSLAWLLMAEPLSSEIAVAVMDRRKLHRRPGRSPVACHRHQYKHL